MVPLALLLGVAIWQLEFIEEAVPRSVAAVVSLVPEGLILLTSLTYAVAAIRMARRGALASSSMPSSPWRPSTWSAWTRPARSPRER